MIFCGDALTVLREHFADESVQCVITSPPYWGLRDYKVDGQLGLEKTPEDYVTKMVEVFRDVRRVLEKDGTLWLNLGDSYASIGRSGRNESPGVGAKQEMKKIERSLHWQAGGGHNFSWSIPSFGTLIKPKDLVGIPWRCAFAMQADGWYLRSDIIWAKPNPMPESVTDRPTKAHEYLFLMSKSERYYYDAEAIKEPSVTDDPRRPYGSEGSWQMDGRPLEQRHGGEPRSWKGSEFHTGKTAEHQLGRSSVNRKRGEFNGKTNELPGREAFRQFTETRNKRSVWTIATQPYPDAHFATFPEKLVEPCILAGSKPGDVVLDPFCGSGTTLAVAKRFGRHGVGIELNPEYVKLAESRLGQVSEVLPL